VRSFRSLFIFTFRSLARNVGRHGKSPKPWQY
jgi:hypothetical protein